MHETLTGVLEKTELTLASARNLISPETAQDVSDAVEATRARLAYPEEVLVIALAGGTGSGKSSLFNVMTQTDEAPVGSLRPTTSEPLAALPARWVGPLGGHLDRLGIAKRVESTAFGHCLVDLPDTDSVVVAHRHRVEILLPLLDVVIWVVDPEKYRDSALHDRYLRPLAAYRSQFLVVLNQTDRLDPGSVTALVDDLKEALADDGLEKVPVIPVAASPVSGPPHGLDDLKMVLDALSKETLFEKLLVDLERTAGSLNAEIGPGVDYRARLEPVIEQAADDLSADDPGTAAAGVTAFVDVLADEVGGPLAERLRTRTVTYATDLAEIARSLPPKRTPSWWKRLTGRGEGAVDRSALAMRALTDLLAPIDAEMTTRAQALANVADLTVTLAKARPTSVL